MSVNLQHNQRGTILTADTTAANLVRLEQSLAAGDQPNDGAKAPFSLHWAFTPQSPLFEDPESCGLMRTFITPPVAFTQALLTQPVAHLDTLTFGWDDRMEALGVTDDYATVGMGNLTAADMARYTVTINIYSRSINSGPLIVVPGTGIVPLHSFTIDGVAAFGTVVRTNPLSFPVSIDLLPNTAYTVQILIPGLYGNPGVTENLCMPSLTLGLLGDTPITNLLTPAAIQNLPVGYPPVPVSPAFVPPTAGQPMAADGPTGVQTQLNAYEDLVLSDQRLYQSAQPGVSASLDGDGKAEPVQSGFATGWARHVIPVTLWESWNSIRCNNGVNTMPFLSGPGPYLTPTGARACIPVPQNFILDRVFVGMNWISPPAPVTIPQYTGWGVEPAGPDFIVRVGVAIMQHGSAQTDQQVAYGDIIPATPTNNVVHRNFYTFSTGSVVAETLYEIPVVGPFLTPGWSNDGTGQPVYMGRTPSEGQNRTAISPQPLFPQQPPTTLGRETHLWVTMTMEDPVDGLQDLTRPDNVRVGAGGHVVYLIGRTPLVGQAGFAGHGRRPGPGEQGVNGTDYGI